MDRSITPYMRTRDSIHRKNSPFYGPEQFTYQPESNSYRCPAGEQLNYGGRSMRNRTYAYIGTRKRCGACLQKAQCTSGAFRFLAIHMDEPARRRARELAHTSEFAHAQRQRKKVEALFAPDFTFSTPTGDYTTLRFLFAKRRDNECNGDITSTNRPRRRVLKLCFCHL